MDNTKRSLQDYEETNSLLKSLHEERKKKLKPEEKKTEEVKEQVLFPDGKAVFMTPINFISPAPDHFLHFRALLYEDLSNVPNRAKTLQSAFLSTFCIENSFIQPLLNIKIPTCLLVHQRPAGIEKVSDTFTVISPAIPDRWGSFHVKLFILKFPSRLRVVVCSANLINCDWSLIGQSLWFQDFFVGESTNSSFQDSLKEFIKESVPRKYSLKEELGIDLDGYDFSSANVEILSSIPGRHKMPCKYGLAGMKDMIEEKYSHFLYQCSSIGAISTSLLRDLSLSFTKNPSAQLDLIFPSHRNVIDSHLGEQGAGVFFLRSSDYEKPDFPKSSLCNIESPSDFPIISGHLSHSKVMIAHNNYEITDETVIYIGSHNFSSAAWGRFEKNNSQIFIRNYELGVVFKSKPGTKDLKKEIIKRLPFKFPPTKYLENDRPWLIASDMNNE